jgi:hypothetical protein
MDKLERDADRSFGFPNARDLQEVGIPVVVRKGAKRGALGLFRSVVRQQLGLDCFQVCPGQPFEVETVHREIWRRIHYSGKETFVDQIVFYVRREKNVFDVELSHSHD